MSNLINCSRISIPDSPELRAFREECSRRRALSPSFISAAQISGQRPTKELSSILDQKCREIMQKHVQETAALLFPNEKAQPVAEVLNGGLKTISHELTSGLRNTLKMNGLKKSQKTSRGYKKKLKKIEELKEKYINLWEGQVIDTIVLEKTAQVYEEGAILSDVNLDHPFIYKLKKKIIDPYIYSEDNSAANYADLVDRVTQEKKNWIQSQSKLVLEKINRSKDLSAGNRYREIIEQQIERVEKLISSINREEIEEMDFLKKTFGDLKEINDLRDSTIKRLESFVKQIDSLVGSRKKFFQVYEVIEEWYNLWNCYIQNCNKMENTLGVIESLLTK